MIRIFFFVDRKIKWASSSPTFFWIMPKLKKILMIYDFFCHVITVFIIIVWLWFRWVTFFFRSFASKVFFFAACVLYLLFETSNVMYMSHIETPFVSSSYFLLLYSGMSVLYAYSYFIHISTTTSVLRVFVVVVPV